MEAIDLLLQMAYRSGAGVPVAHAAARSRGAIVSRASLRLQILLQKKKPKPVRLARWLYGEDINISAHLSLPTGMVMYIISFPTIETQLPLG